MRSVFTKTIAMIVFVVFLGVINVSNVEASTRHSCRFQGSGGSAIMVPIMENNAAPTLTFTDQHGNSVNHAIMNWNNQGFSGIPYTAVGQLANSDCPDRMFYVQTPRGPDMIYFSDHANADAMLARIQESSSTSTITAFPSSTRVETADAPSGGGGTIEIATVNPDVMNPIPENTTVYSCGGEFIKGLPSNSLRFVRIVYAIFQIIVPVILVIMGMIDFAKAVMGQKEDEIKKGQSAFIKRLITAAIIFLVLSFVRLVVGFAGENSGSILQCMNCFLRGPSYCDGGSSGAPVVLPGGGNHATH